MSDKRNLTNQRKPSRAANATGAARNAANRPKRGQSKSVSTKKKKSAKRGKKAAQPTRSLPGVQGVKVKSRASLKPTTPPPDPDAIPIRRPLFKIPSYADEVFAFLLIGLGLLSFFTLLTPSNGEIGGSWSTFLSQSVGIGAFIISALIAVSGGLILLPKVGVTVQANWWRIIAGEFFFVFLLAYLHAGIRAGVGGEAGDIEAFARAIEGGGGGLVGWAIQDIIHLMLGDMVTGIVLLLLLSGSAALMLGFKGRHIAEILNVFHLWLAGQADRFDGGQSVPIQNTIRQVQLARANAASRAVTQAAEDALPAIPGRRSIVTGEQGYVALGLAQERQRPIRISSAGQPLVEIEEEEEELEVEIRFTVQDLPDKKKVRKRPASMPSLELLDILDFERPGEYEINRNATLIEKTAADFRMQVKVIGVKAGPTVTQYAVQPFIEIVKKGETIIKRVRLTRIVAIAQDLSLALAATSVRIQAPVPGTSYVGIEVPNTHPGIVSLRPVLESIQFYKLSKEPLAIALGREVDGTPFVMDLGKMPHLLIGGTTGSGKSVCIAGMATCLIANNPPDRLKLIMLDPKMVELIRFNGLPHLLGHVEVQLDRIVGVLRWVTREMERRYKLMEEAMTRNIAIYNKAKRKKDRLPYIVVMIDELAELMTEYPDDTEHLLTRLAQMARATGIHLVVATQRPSTDIITGLIKANFPARIALAVPSSVDSRVIIDTGGAEDLVGRGDMLFQSPDAMGPVRLQGCFVSDQEMDRIVEFWREQAEKERQAAIIKEKEKIAKSKSKKPKKIPMFEDPNMAPWERALTRKAILSDTDPLLEDAIRAVQAGGEGSASLVQRRLNIGYPRAGRIIDALYRLGVVGEDPGGGRPRKVLIDPDIDPTAYIINWQNDNS